MNNKTQKDVLFKVKQLYKSYIILKEVLYVLEYMQKIEVFRCFKRIIRSNIAKILNCIGVIALFEKRMKKSITILCYHRILPEEVKENVNFPDLCCYSRIF